MGRLGRMNHFLVALHLNAEGTAAGVAMCFGRAFPQDPTHQRLIIEGSAKLTLSRIGQFWVPQETYTCSELHVGPSLISPQSDHWIVGLRHIGPT